MAGRKVGRPAEGDEVKRAPLSFRTAPELRRRIEQAAERNTRSLAQELEIRFVQSLDTEDAKGGSHNVDLAHLISIIAKVIENRHGAAWNTDINTFWEVRAAVIGLLDLQRPPASPEVVEAQAALQRAMDDLPDVPRSGYLAQLLAIRHPAAAAVSPEDASISESTSDEVDTAIERAIERRFEHVDAARQALCALSPSVEHRRACEEAGRQEASDYLDRLGRKRKV